MNGKRFKLVLILLLCLTDTFAQHAIKTIEGKVVDTHDIPLENVTLLLLNPVDSAYVAGIITDQAGNFQIGNIKEGNYLLEASMLGFGKKYIQVHLPVANNKVHIGTIVLKEDLNQIQEVVVTARQKQIELEAGKTVINISTSILGSQGSVLDALKKLPGVMVNEDGTVYLNGQAGVNVLVDDKLTYLSGENLISLLRSMPANSVNKIELLAHPPAKYDAAGNSGMINIRTKKIKTQGLHIAATSGVERGKRTRGYENISLTLRKNKWNIYADYSFYWGDNFNYVSSLRNYLDPVSFEPLDLHMDMSADRQYRYRSHFMRIGTDYDLTERITLGVYMTSNWYNHWKDETAISGFFNDNQSIDSTLTTDNYQKREHTNLTGGANILYKWNDQGSWDFSFDLQRFNHEAGLMQQSLFEMPSHILDKDTLMGGIDGKIRVYTGQTNMKYDFLEKWKLHAGAKTVFVLIDNTALYKNKLNDDWIANRNLSCDFSYDENINAAYVLLNSQWTSAFSTEVGLRLENTYVKGRQKEMLNEKDSAFSQNYTHLFPTLMAQYKLSENHSFAIVYGRRIIRPNYRDLNPFVEVNDRFLHEQGNTELKPELTDNIELSWFFKKQYGFSLFYSYRKHPVAKSYLVEDDNKIIVIPLNLSSNHVAGVKIGLNNISPVNWWTFHVNASCIYKRFHWEMMGNISENKLITPMVHMNNQFTMPCGWSAEVTGLYNGRMAEGQARIQAMWNISAGIRKSLFNNKANIYLYMNDIFLSSRTRIDLRSSLQEGWYKDRHDTRMIGASFTYRFNAGSGTKDSRRNTRTDESKRINL